MTAITSQTAVQTAVQTAAQTAAPPANRPNLFLRSDTMLGVCEGLGSDLGIHPNLLRIAFALAFYFNPPVVVGTYLGLGLLVAGARFAFPDRYTATTAPRAASANDQAPLALAA